MPVAGHVSLWCGMRCVPLQPHEPFCKPRLSYYVCQVYLRIKAAMELAEEARLERDAATSTTAALRQQLEATQVNMADANSCAAERMVFIKRCLA